jgi:putative ABC transport system permease protein
MWSNLWTIGLRVLWKDRLYAGINLVGLAVAFAAATLIALWLRFELTWEPALEDPDRVVGIVFEADRPSAPMLRTLDTAGLLKSELEAALGDRALVARYGNQGTVVARDDRRSVEQVGFADPNFFRIVTVPFLAGDPAHALDASDGLVLTRSAARKYFGDRDPMGQTLELQNAMTARVTGVIPDMPDNSIFRSTVFASSQAAGSGLIEGQYSTSWNNLQSPTLLRLGPDLQESELRGVLDRLADAKYADRISQGMGRRFNSVRLRDVHLMGVVRGQSGGSTSLTTLALVGVLILAIAAVNFVNLATARATRRTREIGVRKALGASRGVLVVQLLAEPLLLAAGAVLVSFVTIEMSLPSVSALLGAQLKFEYWREPVLAGAMLGGGLFVGLLAGLYPALVMSRLLPIAALRMAGPGSGGSAPLRQALVVLQFAASIGLIVLTIFIQRQAEFAREANLTSIGGDPLVVLSDVRRIDPHQRELLLQKLNDAPELRGAAGSSVVQGEGKLSTSVRDDIVPGQMVSYSIVAADQYFLRVHGLRLVAGRDLDDARDRAPAHFEPGMTLHVLANVSAAKLFGYSDPQALPGRTIGARGTDLLEVVGVVEDFPLQSAKEATGPTLLASDIDSFRYVTVRVPGGAVRNGVVAIERIWKEVVPNYPIQRQFADERIERIWRSTQREADVLSAFALVAVLIGCLGLLGLSAYTAERRTKEIGVRKAMGASTADVVKLLVLQLTRPVIAANLLAWPLALWFVQRWLAGFAQRVSIDAWPFVAAGAGTLLLAWAVVIGHALAVGRRQPSYALRYE